MRPADREALRDKLEALVDWLDANPTDGLHDRTLTIEVGVDASHRVTIDLRTGWLAVPKGFDRRKRAPDSAPLGRRVYQSEGRTMRAALGRLHVPRTR